MGNIIYIYILYYILNIISSREGAVKGGTMKREAASLGFRKVRGPTCPF